MKELLKLENWIFDLDNTLYTNEAELFSQVGDRMTLFIQERLSLEEDAASKLRRDYFERYGTTLSGLMQEKSIEPHDFLNFVHDVNYDILEENPYLRSLLLGLADTGKRLLIYTNSSQSHTAKVLNRLGLEGIFEGVFDIEAAQWHPKPSLTAGKMFLEKMSVAPQSGVMFDDLAWNLVTMKKVGLSTVWMDRDEAMESAQVGEEVWSCIDYQTKSLENFLEEVLALQ